MKKTFFTNKNFRAVSGSLILMSVLCLGVSPVKAEASQVELQRGIQSYNSKNYSDALAHLQQYVAIAPHESIGHYYLANCLFNLGYEKPSMDEYAKALQNSTSQKMTDYCRNAIRSMQTSKQAPSSQQPMLAERSMSTLVGSGFTQPSPFDEVNKFNQAQVQEQMINRTRVAQEAERARASAPHLVGIQLTDPNYRVAQFTRMYPLSGSMGRPVVEDLALEKTLGRMSEQSEADIQNVQKNYTLDLETIKQHLADDTLRLNRERDARNQALNDGTRYKTTTVDTADSIKRDIDERIRLATNQSAQTTQDHEQAFLKQIQNIENGLRTSQGQVADARRAPGSQPNLQLAGTDLYTRSYTPSPNPPPPDEMMATPERLILDAHSRPGRTIMRVVRDPAEPPPPPPGTDLKVHGQLVR